MSSIESRVADLVRNLRQVSPTDSYSLMLSHLPQVLTLSCSKAAGAGQAGQAKIGPLFSALGLVMIINCIDRMVKIVT